LPVTNLSRIDSIGLSSPSPTMLQPAVSSCKRARAWTSPPLLENSMEVPVPQVEPLIVAFFSVKNSSSSSSDDSPPSGELIVGHHLQLCHRSSLEVSWTTVSLDMTAARSPILSFQDIFVT
jgi:hypothetical protein